MTVNVGMTANKPSCPNCTSVQVIKNGCIHNGKQNHKCKDCGRQFVEDPQNKIISQETKELIDKLLLEKLPLAGIASVAGVSEPWLQVYVSQKYEAVLELIESKLKKRGLLSVERAEVWSFVRRTLLFSKKLENHLGTIWTFVHHYNASLPL